jgi:3-hydroxymyristoyl/3-hydroxydecanoyl-(acyl carrier protein) dehydratase
MKVEDPVVVDRRIEGLAAEIELVVPHDLRYLEGHFPGLPVVPGVVQIKWVVALAHRYLDVTGGFCGFEALKFQQVLGPGVRATLKLEFVPANGKLRFAFESDHASYSSGRLLLRVAQ